MKKEIFLARAKNGQLDFGSPENQARLSQCVKNNEGKTFRLEMMKTVRSLPQNAFYWLYLGIIEQETGNNANDLHELFKRVLLPPRYIKIRYKDSNGKTIEREAKIPASTTSLSKSDFGEYLDKISAMVNVEIPNPKDAGFYTEYN